MDITLYLKHYSCPIITLTCVINKTVFVLLRSNKYISYIYIPGQILSLLSQMICNYIFYILIWIIIYNFLVIYLDFIYFSSRMW